MKEAATIWFSGLSKIFSRIPRQAVWTIYLVTVTCGLAAILLHQVGRSGAVVLVLVVIAALALIAILEAAARRKIREE